MNPPARPIVPLRTLPRTPSSVQVLVPDGRRLQVDGLGPGSTGALERLRQTSTLELRAVAGDAGTQADTAEALVRLARAAEAGTREVPRLDRVLLAGSGVLAEETSRALAPYAHELRRGADVPAPARPDLVVSVTAHALDLDSCAHWREQQVTVLPVLASSGHLVVGPVLEPAGALCARCVEMSRADRDPGRAHLLEALGPAAGWDVAHPDPAAAQVTAGVAAMVVRSLAAGVPVPAAVSWSVSLPHPVVGHHRWEPHPRCR